MQQPRLTQYKLPKGFSYHRIAFVFYFFFLSFLFFSPQPNIKGAVSDSNPIHIWSNSANTVYPSVPLAVHFVCVLKNIQHGPVNKKQTKWILTQSHIIIPANQKQGAFVLVQRTGEGEGKGDTLTC